MLPLTMVLQAQIHQQVSGTVENSNGNPLIGANILIEGTEVGAATDINGEFIIDYNPSEDFVLIVSYMGYKTVKESISIPGNIKGLSIKLIEDVFKGKEVVVTGLASSRSRDVAEISVGKIDAGKITSHVAVSDFSTLMSGRIPGVSIQKPTGNVGSGFRFDVRSGGGLNGTEQPIIYIDGVQMDNKELKYSFTGGQGIATLADLNPEDIESIEVLKGAAGAASYGTNGGNGVILITTKRGKLGAGEDGRNFKITYKTVTGMNTPSYKYSSNEYESAKLANSIHTDGIIHQSNLSITGGTAATRYYASFDDRNEEGILINKKSNYMDRQSVRLNLDLFPIENLRLSLVTGLTHNEITIPPNDDYTSGWLTNIIMYNEDNVFSWLDSSAIAALEIKNLSKRIIGSVQAVYTPFINHDLFKGLKLTGRIGIDDSHLRWDETRLPEYEYPYWGNNGSRTIIIRQNQKLTYDFNLAFSYVFGNVLTNTSISNQSYDTRESGIYFQKTKFDSGLLMGMQSGEEYFGDLEVLINTRDAGVVFTEEITVSDQLFLTINNRIEYASSIGQKARKILYPGGRIAWRIDRTGFLPRYISMLKLRGAYGVTGTLPDPRYSIPLYWGSETGGSGVGGHVTSVGNEKIKPETVSEFEIGIDGEIDNKLYFELSHYRTLAEKSIILRAQAPSTGIPNSIPTNIGVLKGSGTEVLLQWTSINTSNNRVDISASYSTSNNTVVDLGGEEPFYDDFAQVQVIKEGLPKYAFYMPKVKGALFNNDGTYSGPELFMNEDSSDYKRFYMGVPYAESTYNFTLKVTLFKNLKLYCLIESKQGQKMLNFTRLFAYYFGGLKRPNELRNLLGIAENPDSTITPLDIGSDDYIEAANEFARFDNEIPSNYLEDASFVKVRELSIGYSLTHLLPQLRLNELVSDLNFALSLQNLKTWTNYSGANPESNKSGALKDEYEIHSAVRGVDANGLQIPKSINLSLTVSF